MTQTGMAKAVLILRKATGLSEAEILQMPAARMETYLKALTELYSENE